jgi:DNA processing protein
VPPLPGHFPARNRIIAGLAAAVLVVEAALPSGTFSTADHGLDAGRDVLAVPGSIFYAGSAGCNRLIRQGAQPITCVDDLRDSLEGSGLLEPAAQARRSGTDVGLGGSVEAAAARLSPEAARLLDALRADPMSPDRAAVAIGLDARAALVELAALEALGLLVRYPDGRYGPCAAL